MRKIAIFILSILLMAAIALPASAAGSVSLSRSDKTVHRGDTFTITVKLSGMAKAKAATIEVSVPSGLQLTKGASSNKNLQVTPNLDKGRFLFYSMSDVDINGNLAMLTFKVKSDSSFAEKSISVSVQAGGSTYKATAKVTVACQHKYGNWSSAGGTNHKRTCSICKATETKKHVFDNACDTTCNSCKYTRKTEHKYSNKLSADAQNHFYACTGCGKQKDPVPHTPGDPATEEHAQLCTVCNYEIAPKLEHVHQIVGEIQINDTHHWYDCATCEENAAYEAHVYAFACSSTCSTCGYKREVTHTKAEGDALTFAHDETGHWYPCTVCAEPIEFAQHTSDNDPVTPHCSVCSGELKHVHNYGEDWNCDGDTHWHECACGAKDSETKHTWDEGVITLRPKGKSPGEMIFTCEECGGVDAAVVVGGLPFDLPELPDWAWYAIAGGAALIFFGPLIFMIVVLSKMGKKPKGKFSGPEIR